MSLAPKTVKVATVALSVIVLTAAVWVLRGYVWPGLSSTETETLLARVDPTLYRPDFVVRESLQFTPRFYFNEFILLFARLGLTLAGAYLIAHLIALTVLVSGLRSLAIGLGLGATATAALIVWLLTISVGTLGGVYFYTHAPVPAVWAGAAVAWGAALAVRERWTAAFAWFGVAALLQFLVGFYAGLLALPALLLQGKSPRLPAIACWVVGLALVYLPMRFSGGTETGVFSSAAFVEIYAFIRHPHHLVPSTWGWPAWVQAGAFYLGAWFFLRRTAPTPNGPERAALHTTLVLTFVLLLANYVFIELIPVAAIAKLQPGRITPLAQGVVLALLARRVQMRVAAGDWIGAALLVLIPFTALPGLLLLLAAMVLPLATTRFTWRHAVLAAAVFLAFLPFDPSLAARGVRYALWGVLFAVVSGTFWLAARPRLLAIVAILAVALAGFAARASLDPRWPPFLQQRFAVNALPLDPPGILGRRFGAVSAKDVVVLSPPGAEAWTFKLYGQRTLVVDDKDIPFTERGIAEWRDRMETVLGAKLTPGLDLNAAWSTRTPAQLAGVAQHYGAHYVLTRDDWHPTLPGQRIDREQGWSLWEVR